VRKIAFHLQKGGVGKTTLSVSAAVAMADAGKSTVLLDLDPQGNTTSWLLGDRDVQYEAADVLFGRVEASVALVEIRPRLSLLPTFALDGELKAFGENQLTREPFAFVTLLERLEALSLDVAVMDLSPGMSLLERAVIAATDEVIIPMTPDVFALDGLEVFRDEVRKIEKAYRRTLTYRRLVINALNRSIGQHEEIYGVAKKSADYETFTIGQDPVFRKAQAEHRPAQDVGGRDRMKTETREELSRLALAIAV